MRGAFGRQTGTAPPNSGPRAKTPTAPPRRRPGTWPGIDHDFEDDDELELFEDYEDGTSATPGFFRHAAWTLPARCGTPFRGMPDHGYCNACADAIEAGHPVD